MKHYIKDSFFSKMNKMGIALVYDNVLLKSGYSEIIPTDVDISAKFSRNVFLNCPLVSAPMDTVTESKMAIELAKKGGLGIIHRGISPKEQTKLAARVKFHLNGFIRAPITVNSENSLWEIKKMRQEKKYSFHSFPVINSNGNFVGIITGNDYEFCLDDTKKVCEIMSKNVVVVDKMIKTKEAFDIMLENKKKILPIIDADRKVRGMYVFSDVKRIVTGDFPAYNLDSNGCLRVGAAVGVGNDAFERADLLVDKGIDVIVIDTAHGDSKRVLDTLSILKKNYSNVDIVAGNVSEGVSAKRLADAGADGIKVGQGPGSICTTRIIAGIGCPQLTAVYNCAKAVRGSGIPICADGGIKYSGHITIALGAGADSVMIGSLFASTEESAGEKEIRPEGIYKHYRGMGSIEAMQDSKASRERYFQGDKKNSKLVPEGVDALVPCKGKVSDLIDQLLGGLRSGMGYVGASDIKMLQKKADFHYITEAGISESHPHGIIITKIPPNYTRD